MNLQAVAVRLGLSPERLLVSPLTGGVSSDIFLLSSPPHAYVAKQAIAKLRVKADWPCDPSRIWREVAALKALAHTGSVPLVVLEDRSCHSYVMTVAPGQPWKSLLLQRDASPAIARAIGAFHRLMMAADSQGFEDQSFFDDLRLDPYYRFTATRHPDLQPHFDAAISACRRPIALTHGDWSPKNIMVDPVSSQITALDFECVHLGDPAFDAAFMLNHLVLKAIHLNAPGTFRPCAEAYLQELPGIPWPDIALHLPCLLLARMDGKSPVEYISEDAVKQRVRRFARELLQSPPQSHEEIWVRLSE